MVSVVVLDGGTVANPTVPGIMLGVSVSPPRPPKPSKGEWHECKGWEKRHPDPLPRNVACQGWAKNDFGTFGLCHNCSASVAQQLAADARQEERKRREQEAQEQIEQQIALARKKLITIIGWLQPDWSSERREEVAGYILEKATTESCYPLEERRGDPAKMAWKEVSIHAKDAILVVSERITEVYVEAEELGLAIPQDAESALTWAATEIIAGRFSGAFGQLTRALAIVNGSIREKRKELEAERQRLAETEKEEALARLAAIRRAQALAHPAPHLERGASQLQPREGKTEKTRRKAAQRHANQLKRAAACQAARGTGGGAGNTMGGGHSKSAKRAQAKRQRQGS